MKIGLLTLKIWCQPKDFKSIDTFQNTMHQSFISVSDNIDYKTDRFGFVEAVLIWKITLHSFWRNDLIYKNLIKYLNLLFNDWSINLILTITEKGD